ncbi:MAG: hypothetical protein QM589_04450 [Thermomicrobiales bacterium]
MPDVLVPNDSASRKDNAKTPPGFPKRRWLIMQWWGGWREATCADWLSGAIAVPNWRDKIPEMTSANTAGHMGRRSYALPEDEADRGGIDPESLSRSRPGA